MWTWLWHVKQRQDNLIAEVMRTLIAFICTVSVASIMAWVQLMNDNASVQERIIIQPSLIDASRSIQKWQWVRPWMADATLYIMVGGSVAGLFWYYVVLKRGRVAIGLQVIRRFFWLMAFGYALRGLTLVGTILPPSNPSCQYVQRGVWEAAWAVPKLLAGSIHTCSDKIFSGHTLVATLLAAFWFHLSPPKTILPRIYAASNWCLMVFSSLGGRHHYTVDIVVGAIVAALIFHLYHLLVNAVLADQMLQSAPIGLIENVSFTLPSTLQLSTYPCKTLKQLVIYLDGIDIRRRNLDDALYDEAALK